MEKFINTKKEQFLGFDFLKNHTLPSRDVFDYRYIRRSILSILHNMVFRFQWYMLISIQGCGALIIMIGICRMMCITIMLFLA